MDTVFSLVSVLVAPVWLALAIAPTHPWTQRVATAIMPGLLATVYVVFLVWSVATPGTGPAGGFGSLADLAALFADPRALLAGWIHYLAFDLFVGAWEARDAERSGVSRWALVPCLVLTFLAGPTGLLVYLGLRAVAVRRLSAAARKDPHAECGGGESATASARP